MYPSSRVGGGQIMSRLIDADKLYDYISDVFTQFGHDVMSVKDALEAVENAPTVNAVELPCKVGDTVYYPFAGNVLERQIVCFVYRNGATITFFDECLTESCEITDFGKTVFLTREEAEQALREREIMVEEKCMNCAAKKYCNAAVEYGSIMCMANRISSGQVKSDFVEKTKILRSKNGA